MELYGRKEISREYDIDQFTDDIDFVSERLSQIRTTSAKLTRKQFDLLGQLSVLVDEFYNNDLNVE
ncbi:hypothetical protein FHQ28_05380 [Pasteurellaceae bacterium USgator11]|nr:hypothetical protein FHQ19_09420 [Pasteurellaceae bacterium UScroc12]TNG94747.1 hypothetical protein FHQ20_08120 [Pasteurellaceae bacterium USgator41]TNG97718.1 hypothetical protein FHQ24_09910 [Pasteurellaceae bacterium UScroc31]TNH01679.1 hypothetical protein FHQ28_05380 [Pasteurellaceae bacterium USgator11]